jgi:putative ABC transport system permease protein
MFISDIKSMEEEHADYQMNEKNTIRYFIFGAVFLLLNIFLGLLGTFWFRTQQRRSELALFKALGANNANIFGREMEEGMLLLTLATIPAIIIDWNIAYAELIPRIDGLYLSAGRFIPTIVITYALIALMIFLGTLMPARKAMKIQPADALHEE